MRPKNSVYFLVWALLVSVSTSYGVENFFANERKQKTGFIILFLLIIIPYSIALRR